jgi:FkbM family methyltransferase
MYLNIGDKGVSRELALTGIREELFTGTLQDALRQGDCVVDIGANIGYYALMEARLIGPQGQVYAIEPAPHNMELLQSSVQLNKYSNVRTFQMAIGKSNGVLPFYLSDHPNWCSFRPPNKIIGQINVEVASLDSFLQGKRRPDVVRMDVEGYEAEILTGMNGILESDIPLRLFVEFHPYIMGRQNAVTFLSDLKKYRFHLKKVILEPNIYPPHSGLAWRIVEFLNKRELKMKFGAWEMTLDALVSSEPIMSGRAGDPILFLERDGAGS